MSCQSCPVMSPQNAMQPTDGRSRRVRISPTGPPLPGRASPKIWVNPLAPPACSRCLLQADRSSALPNSSSESQSDAMEWFDQSNRNPTANYDDSLDGDFKSERRMQTTLR
ncbi:hypothetical protein V8C42DRAFT_275925 [Trichoderma barbatum]